MNPEPDGNPIEAELKTVQFSDDWRGRRYLSVREAARYLGLTVHAVRRHIGRGHLPCARIGKLIRIDRVVLDKILLAPRRPKSDNLQSSRPAEGGA